MIKQLIKSVKDLIDGKRHYSLQLLPTNLDYTSTVGEQLTEAKLIDHASGTSDMIRIKLTDHNRFVLRWISATRQMKNIGEYCTTHRIHHTRYLMKFLVLSRIIVNGTHLSFMRALISGL